MAPHSFHFMNQPTFQPPAAAAQKAALRRDVLARRAEISDEARRAAGAAIADAAADIAARAPGAVVSAFISIRGEIDTAPLLRRLGAAGVRLCLPVIVAKAEPLVFRGWRPGEPLEEKRFGLLEPPPSAPELIPDILFVPLAAFDRRGFRLGYGGGFYDRTLEKLRATAPARAIGLAFALQEVDEVPTDAFDQPLDGVLTENGFLAIPGASA
ncbi:MAG TPA: 5-formyltetrahydrofolate cyclo-ligase [Hansschlegelia sp.]